MYWYSIAFIGYFGLVRLKNTLTLRKKRMDNKLVITTKAYSELTYILRELVDEIHESRRCYLVDALKN